KAFDFALKHGHNRSAKVDIVVQSTYVSHDLESRMRRHVVWAVAVGFALATSSVANADLIKAGDLIVVDRGNRTLDDVNPVSGVSTVIATGFSNPQGLAINAQGILFVSDIGTSTIDRVDPITGVV